MPAPSLITIGKAEVKKDRSEGNIPVIVHKVYIEFPVGKRKRFLKTYCTTRMVKDKKAFAKYVQRLIDYEMERLTSGTYDNG